MGLFSILLFSSFMAQATQKSCDIAPLCEKFEDASYKCQERHSPSDCAKFVTHFDKLLKKDQCKRPFDNKPVFDIWYCAGLKGSMSLGLHYNTLANLSTSEARKLYASSKLRATMDGEIAEKHIKPSLKLEASLKAK